MLSGGVGAPLTALVLRVLEALHGAGVVRPAEHAVVQQAELLARAQVPLARVAGEARAVEGAPARLVHPLGGVDVAAAARAAGTVHPAHERTLLFIFIH